MGDGNHGGPQLTDAGVTLHAQVSDALDERGARVVDAVKHRLVR